MKNQTTDQDSLARGQQLNELIRKCQSAGGDGIIREGIPTSEELGSFTHINDQEVKRQLALQRREKQTKT